MVFGDFTVLCWYYQRKGWYSGGDSDSRLVDSKRPLYPTELPEHTKSARMGRLVLSWRCDYPNCPILTKMGQEILPSEPHSLHSYPTLKHEHLQTETIVK